MAARTADTSWSWIDDPATDTSSYLFIAALLTACFVHLILILGVGFAFPNAARENQTTHQLEIIVLRQAAPSNVTPEIADAFAQVDREGGGVEEAQTANDEPKPEPAPDFFEPEPEPALLEPLPVQAPPPLPEPVDPEPAATEQPTDPAILLQPAPESAPVAERQPSALIAPPPLENTRTKVTTAEILASRNLEIAELTARIQLNSAAYANRPRRKAISASTREYKYASYLEAWRRKVERVGNLNYPEEAKRHKMYGNLILHVAVRADGNIERVRVLRSSGFDLLDEAAVKIVELAAPYAPFPPDIRAEADVLDITRTWQFLSSNRLGWEN
ncbi:MAG: energy transducer TonB [Chromatiaceae bacterium]|nr:energy transducer TonB [Chromatiaceae bacterium]